MKVFCGLGFMFMGGLLLLAVVCGLFVMVVKMMRGGSSAGGSSDQSEETRMIQEIYQGLSRMEERVDALETILMERQKKEL
ncbi:MAG: phage-shock protein [Desulfobacteraceae bacterium]|nr:phage-shock protein [Desulfobacteraceae bacterium]